MGRKGVNPDVKSSLLQVLYFDKPVKRNYMYMYYKYITLDLGVTCGLARQRGKHNHLKFVLA